MRDNNSYEKEKLNKKETIKENKKEEQKTNYTVSEEELYKYNDLYAEIGGGE